MSNTSTAMKASSDRLCSKSSGSSGSTSSKSQSTISNHNSSSKTSKTSTSTSKTLPKNPPQKYRKDSKSASAVSKDSTRISVAKPKKTTRSDLTLNRKIGFKNSNLDICKKCGDVASKTCHYSSGITENLQPNPHKTFEDSHVDLDTNIACKSTKSITNTPSEVKNTTEAPSKRILKKEKSSESTVLPLREIRSKTRILNQNVQPKNQITIQTKNQNTLQSKKLSAVQWEKRSTLQTKKQKQSFPIKENQSLQNRESKSSVKQYYKNENFQVFSESAHEIEHESKRFNLLPLDTIKELPELQTATDDSVDSTFRVCSEASGFLGSRSESEEIEFKAADVDFLRKMKEFRDKNCEVEFKEVDPNFLRKLKEFRDQNYFECHSSDARLRSKGSVTSLDGHKCVYRFYLNDRLFPEPLYTDTKRKIRCVDCHLPFEFNNTKINDKKLNGTIQAKVKLGTEDEVRDMIIMLPVKSTTIIKEKRTELKKKEEVVYFGVIKLGPDGYSVFKQNSPSDSLALKYQKGYREFESGELRYETSGEGDVIII